MAQVNGLNNYKKKHQYYDYRFWIFTLFILKIERFQIFLKGSDRLTSIFSLIESILTCRAKDRGSIPCLRVFLFIKNLEILETLIIWHIGIFLSLKSSSTMKKE